MKIDADVYRNARQYVETQLAIMEKHGNRPDLSDARLAMLIHDCAKPAQQFRNRAKREAKLLKRNVGTGDED